MACIYIYIYIYMYMYVCFCAAATLNSTRASLFAAGAMKMSFALALLGLLAYSQVHGLFFTTSLIDIAGVGRHADMRHWPSNRKVLPSCLSGGQPVEAHAECQ